MAIRNIRELGDDILRKNCREVKEVTPRIRELIQDMYDTMYEAQGVGLAGPQVGVLKRVVVIDVDGTPYTMINPRILEADQDLGLVALTMALRLVHLDALRNSASLTSSFFS